MAETIPKIDFYELLNRAVANNITDEERDELWDYLWHCEATDMDFIQYACSKNYIPAYSYLANIYSIGKVCPQDWNKAIEYWKKTASEADKDYLRLDECYINLGDCYRLGNGVEKNFDTAYNYYQLAIENNQERGELPEPTEILLLACNDDDMIERMTIQGVSTEWCEYAIARLEQPVSGIVYRAMANAYTWRSEKCLYWMRCAVDVGDLTAMNCFFEFTNDIAVKKQLALNIFRAENNLDANYSSTAVEILSSDDFSHEEKIPAFKFLNEVDPLGIFDLFQGKDDELEAFFIDIGDY